MPHQPELAPREGDQLDRRGFSGGGSSVAENVPCFDQRSLFATRRSGTTALPDHGVVCLDMNFSEKAPREGDRPRSPKCIR